MASSNVGLNMARLSMAEFNTAEFNMADMARLGMAGIGDTEVEHGQVLTLINDEITPFQLIFPIPAL